MKFSSYVNTFQTFTSTNEKAREDLDLCRSLRIFSVFPANSFHSFSKLGTLLFSVTHRNINGWVTKHPMYVGMVELANPGFA